MGVDPISWFCSDPHVFAGPMSPGKALTVQYLSRCWSWCFESWNRQPLICLLDSKSKKASTLHCSLKSYGHCLFCVRSSPPSPTSEIVTRLWKVPRISTRWPQTPDEGMGTLSGKCGTQENVDGSHLSGKIEGSKTHVDLDLVHILCL